MIAHMKGRKPVDMSEDETKQAGIYKHELFDGKWDWLIAKERMITLPIYNTLITVTEVEYDGSVRYRGGTITSSLKEICPHCRALDCDFDCPDAMEWASSQDIEDQVNNNTKLASNRHYNFACDAIEAMVLAHAIAGIHVESPAYLEGLETAIDAVANNL